MHYLKIHCHLTKKNCRCIITTRKAFQKGYLKTQATPGELLDWNPNNFSDLKEAIKNSDFVINLIGILFENRKQKFYNIHAKIPEAVAKICAESDVKKFIQVSAIGANEKSKYRCYFTSGSIWAVMRMYSQCTGF